MKNRGFKWMVLTLAMVLVAALVPLGAMAAGSYTVTFMAGDVAFERQKVTEGECCVPPSKIPAAPEGMVFVAWQLDGEDFLFDTPVTGNMTLVAAFAEEGAVAGALAMPVAAAAAQGDVATQPEPDPTIIVIDPPTPQAPAPVFWSLANLIIAVLCGVLGALMAAGLLVRMPAGRHSRGRVTRKTGLVWRVGAIACGIMAPVAFVLTQNMANPMTMMDNYTLSMFTLLVLEVMCMLLMRQARYNAMNEGAFAEG